MANSSGECENVQEHSLVREHGMAGFRLGCKQGCPQTINRQRSSCASKAKEVASGR